MVHLRKQTNQKIAAIGLALSMGLIMAAATAMDVTGATEAPSALPTLSTEVLQPHSVSTPEALERISEVIDRNC